MATVSHCRLYPNHDKKIYFNRLEGGEKSEQDFLFLSNVREGGFLAPWLQAGLSPPLLFCCGLWSEEAGSPAAISGGDELGIGDEGW